MDRGGSVRSKEEYVDWRFRLGHIRFGRTARFISCVYGLLSFFSFTLAQVPTRDQLIGTWIGVHSEWDLDFVCPLPTYIQLDADSTYHLGLVDGSATEKISTWAIHGDAMRLDTIHFAPRLVTLQQDLLRIGTNYPMVFRRFADMPIDSAKAYQQLRGRVWQTDSLTIYLYGNGKVALENRTTGQRTAHFWQLTKFGKSVFLVIRGNQFNRNSGYKPLWQLSSLSASGLKAVGWAGRAVATENFRFVRKLTPGDSCRPSGFQTCDNCFRQMWYGNPLSYGQERYDLIQLFAKQYQPIHLPGATGLVRIQFVVNCEGEKGLFDLRAFGEDYCAKTFDARITSQLMSICREQVATDPSLRQTDRSDWRHDLFVSITFRFKDGRITEILP
ncbi:hypothetical protein GCM10028805_40810 [Spirosoma harenae]